MPHVKAPTPEERALWLELVSWDSQFQKLADACPDAPPEAASDGLDEFEDAEWALLDLMLAYRGLPKSEYNKHQLIGMLERSRK